jgi:hypothetical protein
MSVAQWGDESLAAAGLVRRPRDADAAVNDVLVRTRVKADSTASESFDELPGLERGEGFLQRHIQVPATAGGLVLDIRETCCVKDACKMTGIGLDDNPSGSRRRIKIQTQRAHGAVDIVQHDRCRFPRTHLGDRQSRAGLWVLEPAIPPPPNTVQRLPCNQRRKFPQSTVGIDTARRGIKNWRCVKHSVYTFT